MVITELFLNDVYEYLVHTSKILRGIKYLHVDMFGIGGGKASILFRSWPLSSS